MADSITYNVKMGRIIMKKTTEDPIIFAVKYYYGSDM